MRAKRLPHSCWRSVPADSIRNPSTQHPSGGRLGGRGVSREVTTTIVLFRGAAWRLAAVPEPVRRGAGVYSGSLSGGQRKCNVYNRFHINTLPRRLRTPSPASRAYRHTTTHSAGVFAQLFASPRKYYPRPALALPCTTLLSRDALALSSTWPAAPLPSPSSCRVMPRTFIPRLPSATASAGV